MPTPFMSRDPHAPQESPSPLGILGFLVCVFAVVGAAVARRPRNAALYAIVGFATLRQRPPHTPQQPRNIDVAPVVHIEESAVSTAPHTPMVTHHAAPASTEEPRVPVEHRERTTPRPRAPRWRRAAALLAALTLLGGGAAAGYGLFAPPKYRASQQFIVQPQVDGSPLSGTGVAVGIVNKDRAMQTMVGVLAIDAAYARAAAALGSAHTPQTVERAVVVEPVAQSDLLQISATATTPDDAVAIVEAFTSATMKIHNDDVRARAATALLEQTADDRGALSPADRAALTLAARNGDPTLIPVPSQNTARRAGVPAALMIAAGALAGLLCGIVALLFTPRASPNRTDPA